MHFITFPVGGTNIFPLSNSTQGGQLVTEYNLRSREMVATNPAIKYEVGPSFTHSMDDFAISTNGTLGADEYDTTVLYSVGDYCTHGSKTYVCTIAPAKPGEFNPANWTPIALQSSVLTVSPGRAVINGHYVETTTPMYIDLTLANALLKQRAEAPLVGELSIGIRAYYSTAATMSGSMLVENEDNMYVGVQLVVLPREQFLTPDDAPDSPNDYTAHLKLADFVFINGSVADSTIKQFEGKTTYLSASRIAQVDELLNSNYISKSHLDGDKLYTFSGEGLSYNKDTWCDSTGSLMVWDYDPQLQTKPADYDRNHLRAANFISDGDTVKLAIPHQQIDGIVNASGKAQYYPDRVISLPRASFMLESAGTVDSTYTKAIKSIAEKINGYKQFVNGKQIAYLDIKNYDYEMPFISESHNVGDYMVVRADYTAIDSNDAGMGPSTMYIVLPGYATSIKYTTTKPSGIRLGETVAMWEGDATQWSDATLFERLGIEYDDTATYTKGTYIAYGDSMYKANTAISTPEVFNQNHWDLIANVPSALGLFNYTSFRGIKDTDYFELECHNTQDDNIHRYYYKVKTAGPKTWSDAFLITGGIPLATETQVGGFYNTSADVRDGGYVTRDENGRLRLIDYGLLRSGTLAYQLGENYTIPTNLTSDVVQEYLNEYVNYRVAFPFNYDGNSSSSPMIDVYVSLSTETELTNILIGNIDSRFGTGVVLHILGTADSNTVVNIVDCEKIKIDSNIQGTPVINVVRSGLYYDANIIDYIRKCDTGHRRVLGYTGMKDITLWYEKFNETDPDLLVNGMEVSQPDAPMVAEDISFWDNFISNDNHFTCALRSVTFSGSGNIIGCSMYVANGSTATNYTDGRVIIGGKFNLPQGSELNYPESCITQTLRVTGAFVSAYALPERKWAVSNTTFTAQTGTYSEALGVSDGTIAFNSDTSLVDSTHVNVPSIDCWRPGTYHVFYGGITI